jgi:N-acetylgalactosamine kinase
MSSSLPDYTVILAAGRGTRMGVAQCPKVCFKVNGVPAINRALKIYQQSGIPQHVVIVGNLAGQVIETVGSEFDNVAYVYQKEQLGTAHALRCFEQSMGGIPDEADLLVVAGDRLIDVSVLERLFDEYFSNKADLALLSLRCRPQSGQGRIACDARGCPAAIIEMADIRQRETFRILRNLAKDNARMELATLRKMLEDSFFGEGKEVHPAKGERAFGELWKRLQNDGEISAEELSSLVAEDKTYFTIVTSDAPIRLTPTEAEQLPYGNTSVYLLKHGTLKEALRNLSRDNAQQEEYLSDLIHIVYSKALQKKQAPAIRMLKVDDPNLILGFNNPAELLEVEKVLRDGSLKGEPAEWNPKLFRPLREWQQFFAELDKGGSPVNQLLREIYGNEPEIIKRQSSLIIEALEKSAESWAPDSRTGIVRMPGRLNVMGRHVDHQGGNCNLMTISFETIMLVHPRTDDLVTIKHCDEAHFPGSQFSISGLVAELPWEDWNSVVNSEALMKRFREYGVGWSEYIKAAVLRLQKKFSTQPLRGMDLTVAGNIPMAAGLSSSSSLIVGAAEAAVASNALKTFPAQLVTLCGEGEWFVGTRGGSADHAAVKMGSQGSVVKVKFFNFAVEETVAFPEEYSMVVCDSGIKARKSSDAKNQFNHRISCYRIGFQLIRHFFPQYRNLLQHLRDVNVRTLQAPLATIYRILLMLPEKATLPELQAMLPDVPLQEICSGHQPPADGLYPIRGVVLFGLAEAERSAVYADYLKNGDMDEIGRMMQVSHDGDRVCSFSEDWTPSPFRARVDNAYILERLADLESGMPDRVIRSQLINQPGSYACSLPDIDRMVDIALRTPGVSGAQLAGAGLGGCMMVLCESQAVVQLKNNLTQLYYEQAGIEPAILVCRPVAGGGMLPFRQ